MSEINAIDRLLKSFERHSSPLDWCEPNYAVTSSITEFYNTVSNLIFLLLPLTLIYLFHPFAKLYSSRIQFVWVLNIVIGICSAYFHATLSLAGQLLDEFGILWMFAACIAFWMPKEMLRRVPGKIFDNRQESFETGMFVVTVVLTVLGCFWPVINSLFLMIVTLPVAAILICDLMGCRDPGARSVAFKALAFWVAAVTVWLSDRFACGLWRTLSLPGIHWLWHLLSALSAYHGVVYVVYQDAVAAALKEVRPFVRLWPSNDWRLMGVAYVELRPQQQHRAEANGNLKEACCKNC